MRRALPTTSEMGVARLSLAVDSTNAPALETLLPFWHVAAGQQGCDDAKTSLIDSYRHFVIESSNFSTFPPPVR